MIGVGQPRTSPFCYARNRPPATSSLERQVHDLVPQVVYSGGFGDERQVPDRLTNCDVLLMGINKPSEFLMVNLPLPCSRSGSDESYSRGPLDFQVIWIHATSGS